MPCSSFNAKSGQEYYDEFLETEKGKEALCHIIKAASIIMSHNLPAEAKDWNIFAFRQVFVTCFLHMMFSCSEQGKPKAN
jgi:hypothetical protein